MELKIEYLPVTELKPYENNARKHAEADIEAIKKSIEEFGFNDPIGIWHDTIVEGHGRLLAAQELEMAEVPVIRLDHMTDEERRAYALAHNKTAELSEWDFEMLDTELEDIFDIDMSEFGFELNLDDEEPQEVIEDEVPEEVETRCKLGDLWQLGNHRLVCGDSTDVAVIDRLMDGVKADMVFTDPPYGYNYQSNMRTKTEKFDVLENDDKILDFLPNLLGRVKGFVMICTTWKVLDKWMPLFKQYFDLSNMIIWDKGGGYIGDLKHTFGTDYEIILCSSNNAEIKGKRIGSVWSIRKDKESDYEHPTQKPVELSATAISSTTEQGNIVLDCFGGSGSTLIACEQLNRKCYMCELDPHYCDVILQRWEDFTGQKAVLLNE